MVLIIDLGNYFIKVILYDDKLEEIERVYFPTLKYNTHSTRIKGNSMVQLAGYLCSNGKTVMGVGKSFDPLDPINVQLILDLCRNGLFKRTLKDSDISSIYLQIPLSKVSNPEFLNEFSESFADDNRICVTAQTYFIPFEGIIVDIGGGTTDMVYKRNGEVIYQKCFNIGMKNVLARIRDEINQTYNQDIDLAEVRHVLEEGTFFNDSIVENISDEVDDILEDFWNELFESIQMVNTSNQPLYIVGGASRQLHEFFNYRYNDDIFLNITSLANYLSNL